MVTGGMIGGHSVLQNTLLAIGAFSSPARPPRISSMLEALYNFRGDMNIPETKLLVFSKAKKVKIKAQKPENWSHQQISIQKGP